MRLRSIELQLKDAGAAGRFLSELWGLLEAGRSDGTAYFRGTGDQPYVVSVRQGPADGIVSVTFVASADEIQKIAARAKAAGARHQAVAAAAGEPGAAEGLLVAGPEGQVFRILRQGASVAAVQDEDKPIAVTHVVLNASNQEATTKFAMDVLGFKLSDRTKAMDFLRCDPTHHSLAIVNSDRTSLNHIAFEVPTLEAVMRGIGRMQDAGYNPVWGPGRHGPGNNVFGYFAAPFGAIVEYTSEVQRIGDDYKVGYPDDWTWPPGREDHWGISKRDLHRMEPAERMPFLPFPA